MNTYLSVVKSGDEYIVRKTYYGGVNVVGNKTGTLWHDASKMSLETRIEEGIYLRVDVPTSIDVAFATYEGVDVVFDHKTAEVRYTDKFKLMSIEHIRDILKDRVITARDDTFQTHEFVVQFKGHNLKIDRYLMDSVTFYNNLVLSGGNLPENAMVAALRGESIPIDNATLKEIIQVIFDTIHSKTVQFVTVCANIDAANTYEEARSVALWDGYPL